MQINWRNLSQSTILDRSHNRKKTAVWEMPGAISCLLHLFRIDLDPFHLLLKVLKLADSLKRLWVATQWTMGRSNKSDFPGMRRGSKAPTNLTIRGIPDPAGQTSFNLPYEWIGSYLRLFPNADVINIPTPLFQIQSSQNRSWLHNSF